MMNKERRLCLIKLSKFIFDLSWSVTTLFLDLPMPQKERICLTETWSCFFDWNAHVLKNCKADTASQFVALSAIAACDFFSGPTLIKLCN